MVCNAILKSWNGEGFKALRLLRQGLNQSEVARRVRVVRQSVARWAALDRKGGERALRQAGRAGRKPRLTERQKSKLEQLPLAGPGTLGLRHQLVEFRARGASDRAGI